MNINTITIQNVALPKEIVVGILKKLPTKDLIKANEISKQFNEIVNTHINDIATDSDKNCLIRMLSDLEREHEKKTINQGKLNLGPILKTEDFVELSDLAYSEGQESYQEKVKNHFQFSDIIEIIKFKKSPLAKKIFHLMALRIEAQAECKQAVQVATFGKMMGGFGNFLHNVTQTLEASDDGDDSDTETSPNNNPGNPDANSNPDKCPIS